MNCDRIAPFYRWFERLAFGDRLQRHRVAFLKAVAGKRRVLIVGDGDGRFAQALFKAFPDVSVDWLEISAGMVREAGKRLGSKPTLRMLQQDALEFVFEEGHYDLLFTHFFLDCFDGRQVNSLVRRLSAALTSDGVWIVSDFRQAADGWRKIYTRAWLTTMYLLFRYSTGLETNLLPEYGTELEAFGFVRRYEQTSMAGLIASEWWQR